MSFYQTPFGPEKLVRYSFLLTLAFWLATGLYAQPAANTLDIVLVGGRVMDPETGLDAIRNVGIRGDRIVEISAEPLTGKQLIDVSGLVVAPGFIDIHVHGQTNEAHAYQVRDGVTTALELESGIPFLGEWLKTQANKTLINYGASVAQSALRGLALTENAGYRDPLLQAIRRDGLMGTSVMAIYGRMQSGNYQALTPQEQEVMIGLIQGELDAGALGIGVPVGYYPGASRGEILAVYEFAAARKTPVFSHTRGFGLPGIQEAISCAAVTGAPLHIVHLNSLSLGEIQVGLDMVADAQRNGLDITTEVYPYTAASTSLESAIFDEGWQKTLGITYEDIQWEATGERLTAETFAKYRKQGGVVIIHMMKPEWIETGLASPVTMVASDGMPYAPGAHPRTAGTFSRTLGRYVREEKTLTLMEALRKMTLMPAQRMEGIAPAMRLKGRIQVGADADITIFDPAKVIDKATFSGLEYSEGIPYVLVNGVVLVQKGQMVENTFPGRPVLGKYRK